MKLHNFIGNFDFSEKDIQIIELDLVNQIRNVLRFEVGDKIILGDGKMNEVLVEISEMTKDFINAKILEVRLNKNEPQKGIILYCAILKRENFELVCQKAVEIGVCEVVPIICARTVKFGLKEERLKKIIKEAAEQAGRGIVPKLGQTISLGKAMVQAKNNDFNLFFDANGVDLVNIKPVLAEAKKIGIFIGPEGGWEGKEIEVARNEENFKIISLGKLTLRAETAAIIGSYIGNNLE
jgi:16S rRNA (uracil1498-N3)-methyltransferase